MRSPQNLNLPSKGVDYSPLIEQAFKKAVEDAYQLLRADIVANRDHNYKQSSLSLRRHQFLLMGAPDG